MTTSTHSNYVLSLEQKEDAGCKALTARSAVSLFLHPTCMTITRTRIIPQVSTEGTTDIPFDAFADIEAVVQNEFDANIAVHNHTAAGSFHGRPFVNVAHYLLELTAERDDIDEIISRIEPMVEDLIERHTRQLALPIES
ncbi:MAG: hypothetical protein WB973_17125 [Thermoanaerobaculia bacterium]